MVVEAEHSCVTVRGVRAGGALTRTSVLTGVMRATLRLVRSSSLC